jgi:hypothetical protein
MRQINLNVTPEFDQDLRTYMRRKGITSKSEAIRRAVHEGAANSSSEPDTDYHSWIGLGLKAPLRQKRRFKTEDDLWS